MSYQFHENEGLITVLINGQIPHPFMYIDARKPPPWTVEPVNGGSREFDSLEAAKMALVMAVQGRMGDDDG